MMRNPVTNLARMYQERIPTGSTKVGPRQTTIEDVRRVAARGSSAMPRLKNFDRFSSAPDPLDPSSIQSSIIGGPGAGYGLKYGGFPTMGAMEDAILGEAYGAYEMADLARQQAAQLGQQAEEDYRYNIGMGPDSVARKKSNELIAIARKPLEVLAREMSPQEGVPFEQNLYGANMARMDAVRGTGDYVTPEGKTPSGLQQIQYNAQAKVEPQLLKEYERAMIESGADTQNQIADIISETPLSQYARQIATARYGMDPAQAAGMFTPQLDVKFRADQENARRAAEGMPQITMDQFIWDNFGPEEYNNYMMNKAEQLVYGSPEEMAQAEQDAIDLANDLTIEETYGFRPTDISGADPTTIRDAFGNADFQTFVSEGIKIYNDPNKMMDYGSPAELGKQLAQDWIAAGGTFAQAQVLESIFATFDFVS